MQAVFRYYNRKYIFPVQFATCIAGNTLNLIVLSGRNMRTKTNCFLTAMAVADLSFFLAMLLPTLDYLAAWLREGYFFLHIPFVAFANWFSAASIWLTVAVTLERLIATKPRRAPSVCRTWDKRRTFLLIALIYASTLVLSLYHFAWRRVKRLNKNGTTNGTNSSINYRHHPYTWESVVEKNEPVTYWYVQSSHLLFGVLVVIGPLLVLFVLNCVIVCRLRSHNRHISGSLFSGSDSSAPVAERIRRRERRATLTVVLLVSVFIIFTLPSGLFSVIEFLGTKFIKLIFIKPWYWQLGEACNALVCTGKAINFWLYCSASSDYRRELRNVLTCRRCRNARTQNEYGDPSTSRVSSTCPGPQHRRPVTANWRVSQVCSNDRETGMTTLL